MFAAQTGSDPETKSLRVASIDADARVSARKLDTHGRVQLNSWLMFTPPSKNPAVGTAPLARLDSWRKQQICR